MAGVTNRDELNAGVSAAIGVGVGFAGVAVIQLLALAQRPR
ncbi:hypothetical protein OK015_09545 [Mycobacterium sp. Aquia_216]|nr:hypothetical protein [Mycobacterium sp. Aquia_216]WAJ46672.1 hypothetical protein OK015_09545 [Mycobacterium sp. Aquia_216]